MFSKKIAHYIWLASCFLFHEPGRAYIYERWQKMESNGGSPIKIGAFEPVQNNFCFFFSFSKNPDRKPRPHFKDRASSEAAWDGNGIVEELCLNFFVQHTTYSISLKLAWRVEGIHASLFSDRSKQQQKNTGQKASFEGIRNWAKSCDWNI